MKHLLGRAGLTFCALLIATVAFAQNAGSLRGTVTDSSGAVTPGVKVVLTNDATKYARTLTTDAKGAYYFAAVEPGVYTLKADKAGFKTREIKELRVSPNDTLGVDLRLEVGEHAEVVVVSAVQENIIQNQTGAREGLITAKQIESLSLIGRGAMELLRILPGVVAQQRINDMQVVASGSGSNGTAAYNINGMRGTNNVVSLDGAPLLDIGANNGTSVALNNDFVAEVKIQASNYAAEFGSSSAQINAISKGGSSEFHGSLYDYYQPYQLSANDRSRNYAGQVRPKSLYNYPGLTLGGPIVLPGFNKNHDKAFFFIGAEYQRQKIDPTSGTSYAVVPTLNQRQGLFNDYQTGQMLNQTGKQATVLIPAGYPGAGTPAPGGDLRPYANPFGKALLDLIAMPNYVDPNNRYNYAFPSKTSDQNRYSGVLRLDYNVSDSTRAYVRLAQDRETTQSPLGLWWNSSGSELPSPIEGINFGRSAALNVTSVLSPTTTNEFLFTYHRQLKDNSVDRSKVGLSALGFPNYHGFFGQQTDLVPGVNFWDVSSNSSALYFGLDSLDMYAYNGSVMLSDTVTKVMNTHAVKIGFNIERSDKEQNFNNNANTVLDFSKDTPGSTGNNYGDLFVGLPAQVTSGPATSNGKWIRWNYDFFGQDSWKIRKNFTLEYGLRVGVWPAVHVSDYHSGKDLDQAFVPATYVQGQPAFLDAAKTKVNGVVYGDAALVHRPVLLMPRLNFAWDVTGQGDTVVRGGAGVFYNREETNAQSGMACAPPNCYSSVQAAWWNTSPMLTLDTISSYNPFNNPAISSFGYTTQNTWSQTNYYPRIVSTSLSVSRRIFWKQMIEVGYVGTFGRHQMDKGHINVIPPGYFSSGTAGNANLSDPLQRAALDGSVYNAARPYPALGDITDMEFNATSDYNALQATLSRQAGKFNYFIAYTFSKVLGLSGADGWTDIDPFDARARSHSVLNYDRSHVLNASWNWSLPDAVKSGPLKYLLNGWNISGISNFASGAPIKIPFSNDLTADSNVLAWYGTHDYSSSNNAGKIAPVLTCDPRQSGSKVGDKILNVNCIGIPSFGQSGPFQTPYYLRYPATMNHDVTLFKNIALSERTRLQLRIGAFDVFNQAFPSLSNNDIDLGLQTTCNVRVDHVPNGAGGYADNVCNPQGGFALSANSVSNFGKITNRRGHRVIEVAAKLTF